MLNFSVFRIFVVVLVLMDAESVRHAAHEGGGMMMRHCWPDNVTDCFSGLAHLHDLWPTASRDSYGAGQQMEVFDFEEYSVTQVQKDPRHFCEYKDEVMAGLACMTRAVKSKCPDLPEAMIGHVDRFRVAFNGFCSRVDDVEPWCLQNHWKASLICRNQVLADVGNSWGMSSAWKPNGSSGSKPPPKPGSWGSPARTSDEETIHHQHGQKDTPSASSSPSPRSQQHRQPGMYQGSGKPLGDAGRMDQAICFFHYKMIKCVKKTMAVCHGQTAAIVARMMQDLASPTCAAKMDVWDTSATGPPDCQGPGCGGAGRCSVAALGTTALLLFCLLSCIACARLLCI